MPDVAPEQDELLLEHSYDGIQEYDNPLPGWWVTLFWAPILMAPFYVVFFHFGVGSSIEDQYNTAAAAHFEKQAEVFANMEITEETIAAQMSETALMGGMRLKFEAKCATCHGQTGAGLACPNLTDGHAIHGARLLEIYQVLRDGVPGKEMKSWRDELGPHGLVGMAAFIGTLRNTNAPGGKAPEGQPFELGE